MSIRHDPPPAATTSLPRVRATEGIGPRPSELIADRLFAVAALAQVTRPENAESIDVEALSKLASEQRRDEEELIQRWDRFRSYYLEYLTALPARQSTLKRALDALSIQAAARAGDPSVRSALRVCRLRRPPLAKVEAIVAAAQGERLAVGVTETRRRLR
jgi:hypothetical protein